MADVEKLRALLRRYPTKRMARESGISAVTVRRIRDGLSSPTFDMHDAMMRVIFEDAIAAAIAQRPPLGRRPGGASRA